MRACVSTGRGSSPRKNTHTLTQISRLRPCSTQASPECPPKATGATTAFDIRVGHSLRTPHASFDSTQAPHREHAWHEVARPMSPSCCRFGCGGRGGSGGAFLLLPFGWWCFPPIWVALLLSLLLGGGQEEGAGGDAAFLPPSWWRCCLLLVLVGGAVFPSSSRGGGAVFLPLPWAVLLPLILRLGGDDYHSFCGVVMPMIFNLVVLYTNRNTYRRMRQLRKQHNATEKGGGRRQPPKRGGWDHPRCGKEGSTFQRCCLSSFWGAGACPTTCGWCGFSPFFWRWCCFPSSLWKQVLPSRRSFGRRCSPCAPFWVVVVISPSSGWTVRSSSFLLLTGAAVLPLLCVVLLPLPFLWGGGVLPLPASGWWRCLASSPVGGDPIPSLWVLLLPLILRLGGDDHHSFCWVVMRMIFCRRIHL